MLKLLKGLGLSWPKARPVHPEADPKAQARFKEPCPACSRTRRTGTRKRRGSSCGSWMVERVAFNRVGQKGRLSHVWYQKGVRPRGVRQQGFSSAPLFAAVCPERGEGVALVLPEGSTAAVSLGSFAPKSWPSAAGRSRPGPTPRSCSTGPAGTSART
jgi:winged helix-turn-helix protein